MRVSIFYVKLFHGCTAQTPTLMPTTRLASFRCYHDRDNSDAQTEYAHGYRYCNSTDPYRTIMSYPCTNDYTVARVNWFSSPDVILLDKATGTTDNDCARAIEENMVISQRRSKIVYDRPRLKHPLDYLHFICRGLQTPPCVDEITHRAIRGAVSRCRWPRSTARQNEKTREVRCSSNLYFCIFLWTHSLKEVRRRYLPCRSELEAEAREPQIPQPHRLSSVCAPSMATFAHLARQVTVSEFQPVVEVAEGEKVYMKEC